MLRNKINANDIHWFIIDKTVYPYIFNNDNSRIKELIKGTIIPLPEDYGYDRHGAVKTTITRITDNDNIKLFETENVFADYLNFSEWFLISGGKPINEVMIDDTKLKLVKYFFEKNIERKRKQQAKKQRQKDKQAQIEFDERDF